MPIHLPILCTHYILVSRDYPGETAPVLPPPTSVTAPVGNHARARRVGTRHNTAVDLLLHTPADVAPGPAPRVVDGRGLQVDPAAQAAGADAGGHLLGALRGWRVVDGAVPARRVAVATCLHPVGVDACGALGAGAVGAAVVDVEDVEGVYVAGNVPVCGIWLVVGQGRGRDQVGRLA